MTQLSNRKEGRWAQGVQTPAWPHQDVSRRLVCVESSPAGWSGRRGWLAGWLVLTGPLCLPQTNKVMHHSKELRLLCAEDEQGRTCWMTAFRLLKVPACSLQTPGSCPFPPVFSLPCVVTHLSMGSQELLTEASWWESSPLLTRAQLIFGVGVGHLSL